VCDLLANNSTRHTAFIVLVRNANVTYFVTGRAIKMRRQLTLNSKAFFFFFFGLPRSPHIYNKDKTTNAAISYLTKKKVCNRNHQMRDATTRRKMTDTTKQIENANLDNITFRAK
jgi:hypothetical protein